MAVQKRVEFVVDHHFDPENCRHYLNGACTVLHCHHYATLYTQIADDAVEFEGLRHLTEAAEDTFFDVLDAYYRQHAVGDRDEKLALAGEYWRVNGMGLIEFRDVRPAGLTAEMDFSHVDAGWLRKWGPRDKPVNFITGGFIAAVAALANGKPKRSYAVAETKALVRGDRTSEFQATLR